MTGIQSGPHFGAVYVVSKEKSEAYRAALGEVWDGYFPVTEWFQLMDVFIESGDPADRIAPPPSEPVSTREYEAEALTDGRTVIITNEHQRDIDAFYAFRDTNEQWSRFIADLIADSSRTAFQTLFKDFLAHREAQEQEGNADHLPPEHRIQYIG